MKVNYKKISILVFVENTDIKKYFNLFKFLLKEKITKELFTNNSCRLEGENFVIRFETKNIHLRNLRTHYVINMIQDIDFHNNVALPCSRIFSLLDKDKWAELFK